MKTKTKDAFKTILNQQSQNVVILFLSHCFIVSIENHYYDPLCFGVALRNFNQSKPSEKRIQTC